MKAPEKAAAPAPAGRRGEQAHSKRPERAVQEDGQGPAKEIERSSLVFEQDLPSTSQPTRTPSPHKERAAQPPVVSSYFSPSPYYEHGHAGRSPSSSQQASSSPTRGQAAEPSPTRHYSIHSLPTSPAFFGLIQEQVEPDTFKLLVSVILLNQTRGTIAIPVFWEMMLRWPCAEAMAEAEEGELERMLRPLGIHRIRAARLIQLGRAFINDPPREEKRRRSRVVRLKSQPGEGEEGREERYPDTPISHLPGVGRYALDSWRIFIAEGGAKVGLGGEKPRARELELIQRAEEEFLRRRGGRTSTISQSGQEAGDGLSQSSPSQPSTSLGWRTVKPLDKELRAYLVWRWAKEGRRWDPGRGVVGDTTERELSEEGQRQGPVKAAEPQPWAGDAQAEAAVQEAIEAVVERAQKRSRQDATDEENVERLL